MAVYDDEYTPDIEALAYSNVIADDSSEWKMFGGWDDKVLDAIEDARLATLGVA